MGCWFQMGCLDNISHIQHVQRVCLRENLQETVENITWKQGGPLGVSRKISLKPIHWHVGISQSEPGIHGPHMSNAQGWGHEFIYGIGKAKSWWNRMPPFLEMEHARKNDPKREGHGNCAATCCHWVWPFPATWKHYESSWLWFYAFLALEIDTRLANQEWIGRFFA